LNYLLEHGCCSTIHEIAQYLGWVTQPKFKEYDVSAPSGPVGLSAAVMLLEGLRTVLVERHAVGGGQTGTGLVEHGFPGKELVLNLAEYARQRAIRSFKHRASAVTQKERNRF